MTYEPIDQTYYSRCYMPLKTPQRPPKQLSLPTWAILFLVAILLVLGAFKARQWYPEWKKRQTLKREQEIIKIIQIRDEEFVKIIKETMDEPISKMIEVDRFLYNEILKRTATGTKN